MSKKERAPREKDFWDEPDQVDPLLIFRLIQLEQQEIERRLRESLADGLSVKKEDK